MIDVGMFLNCEGSGLYKLQSTINHSCCPNAQVTFPFNNHKLVLQAITDINEGEEICISYLDECALNSSRHTRQKVISISIKLIRLLKKDKGNINLIILDSL